MNTCKCGRVFEKHQSLSSHKRWCTSIRDVVNRTTFNRKTPKHKGKTFEEAYGDDAAKKYKKKLSDFQSEYFKKNKRVYSNEARRNMSIAASKKMSKHTKWFSVGGIKVQGTWELNVCKILLEEQHVIKRHAIVFNNTRRYTPDVFLEDLGIYIEVKGWFMKRDILKYKIFCNEHPNLDIRLICKHDYQRFVDREIGINDLPQLKEVVDHL